MSSSGITPSNTGPLIIRTYNDNSSNKTYLLREYDYPISSNYVLITSTNGQLVPSNNIYVSSISVSSITANNSIISTAYLSTILSINSTITFKNEVIIDNANQTESGPPSLLVVGPTVMTEPGAISTVSTILNVYGAQAAPPIEYTFTTTSTITINEPINKIRFQMIGSGGANIFSNSNLPSQDKPGYGAYIAGNLSVKQGNSLCFTIGQLGNINGISSSGGTSLIYISSNISTLIAIAGAGGGNGFSQTISSSSGGGHGGGSSGRITGPTMNNFINGVANGTNGYDGLLSIGGNLQSIVDGGIGGLSTIGGQGGASGSGISPGQNGSTFINNPFGTSFINGGMVLGGSGGINISTGGTGGGGFNGGGGGAASTIITAGGGGGASFINYTLLKDTSPENPNGILSDVICLGGEFLSNKQAVPFGNGYGQPNYQGFGCISGYIPNDTIYTNGDIQCRVLRYEQLDPPISELGGGSSALWALYPAIDNVQMNDNPIIECGGIQITAGGSDIVGDSIFRNQLSTLDKLTVTSGGIDVSNFVNISAGNNDTLGTSGFISQFIRTASSGTYTVDYQVAGDSTNFGKTWQDARYVYNSENTPSLAQVWGIVTSSNITPVGSTIGDIHFYNSVYIDGKVGIGTINPSTNLQVIIPDNNAITGISAKSAGVNTTIGAYSTSNYGSIQVTSNNNTDPYILTLNPIGGDIIIGSTINNLYINCASTQLNELVVQGNEYLTGKLDVTNTALFRNQVSTLNQITVTSNGINITGNSIFNNILCASTLCTSTLSMSNGQLTDVSSISGDTIYLNSLNVSTLGNNNITGNNTVNGTSLLSGFVTINNSVNVASTLCASTLCTSTLTMTNGQLTGVSSISGNNGNLSTLGNFNVVGDLTVSGAIQHPDVPPVGAINMYGGSSDPAGWLICNGREINRIVYNSLSSVIGLTFGVGDGVNTFNIPDLRDKFPIGTLTNPLGTAGGGTATLTEANIPSHKHGIVDPGHSHTATHNLRTNNTTTNDNNNVYEKDTADDDVTAANFTVTIISNTTGIVSTTNTGSGTAFNVVPAFLSLNYIIKY